MFESSCVCYLKLPFIVLYNSISNRPFLIKEELALQVKNEITSQTAV